MRQGRCPPPPVKVSYVLVYRELFVYSVQGRGGEERRLIEFAFHIGICISQHRVVGILKVHNKKVPDIVGAIQPLHFLYTHFT